MQPLKVCSHSHHTIWKTLPILTLIPNIHIHKSYSKQDIHLLYFSTKPNKKKYNTPPTLYTKCTFKLFKTCLFGVH